MNMGKRRSTEAGRTKLGRRQFTSFAVAAPALTLIAGCSALERTPPAPPTVAGQTTVLGLPNARFWPETQTDALVQEAEQALMRERTPPVTSGVPVWPLRPARRSSEVCGDGRGRVGDTAT